MRDLEGSRVVQCLKIFAGEMRHCREKMHQSAKLYYRLQKQRWLLHAVETYCGAVQQLDAEFSELPLASDGLREFREYLRGYLRSAAFAELWRRTRELTRQLRAVQYCVLIKENGFRVRKCEAESDYSAEVAATFRKFQQGVVKDYSVSFIETKDTNHVEAKILEFVSVLCPEIFQDLDDFCGRHAEYVDSIIGRFDREIQFYISYLDYVAPLRSAGLRFCYPEFSVSEKEVLEEDGFDLALAAKLVAEKRRVVCNEFHLNRPERIFIVSGPNQGGKTTFARTFGQLHHLARFGFPVPGSRAKLFLCDSIYVHFERPENLKDMHGKLQDDLLRIRRILQKATSRSIIIMNEIFTSTTLKDASFLSRRMLDRIVAQDCLCVCVTFLQELSRLNEKTVSMVSTIVPENPAERTYKVIRRPADGRAYAVSVAEKYEYGLTHDRLKARIRGGARKGRQQ